MNPKDTLHRHVPEQTAEERLEKKRQEAQERYAQGLKRVASTPPPEGQKYLPETRVRIADCLGFTMSHFPRGVEATVKYTYAHAYGNGDVRSYCLDVDGHGTVSWYHEEHLTAIENPAESLS